jgi:hypothetical protein
MAHEAVADCGVAFFLILRKQLAAQSNEEQRVVILHERIPSATATATVALCTFRSTNMVSFIRLVLHV